MTERTRSILVGRRRTLFAGIGAALSCAAPLRPLFAGTESAATPQNVFLSVPPIPDNPYSTALTVMVDGPHLKKASVERVELWMEGVTNHLNLPVIDRIAEARFPPGQRRARLSTRIRLTLSDCDTMHEKTIYARAEFSDGRTETVSRTSRAWIFYDSEDGLQCPR